ncbi:MAG: HEAT repeat domain-containing protein [Polyangiaceae bacterium]|nr:HEAT repeat domain-containing protein [Polyangiaceae bacterium]
MRAGRMLALWAVVAVASPAGVAAAPARPGAAKPAERRKTAAERKREEAEARALAALEAELSSGDAGRLRAALESAPVRELPPERVSPLVAASARRGAPPELLVTMARVLGELRQESASPVLAALARHRNAEVRRSALRALARTRGAAAVAALRLALRGSDRDARGLAATGLGELGAAEATADLSRALDLEVTEAALALGRVCRGEGCGELLGRLGRVPLGTLGPGLHAALLRTGDALPPERALEWISKLREVGTPEVGRLLAGVARAWPEGAHPPVRQALEEAARANGAEVDE